MLPGEEEWRSRGREVEVFSRRVFVVEAGAEDAPTLCVLHGYPTSSHDYARVLDPLARSFRVVIHDHLGFGLSEKPEAYSYSLIEQAEVALQLWRQLGIERAHLLAHDYGTSVATEILARRERGGIPIDLSSLVLTNGSIHIELAKPRLIQHLLANPRTGPVVAKLVSRATLERNLRAVLARTDALTDADIDTMWRLLEREHGRDRFPRITRYLHERERLWDRWVGALTRLDLSTLILWADRDPVAVPAIAEALADEIPSARLDWMRGVGHFPMLEAPEDFVRHVLAFLQG